MEEYISREAAQDEACDRCNQQGHCNRSELCPVMISIKNIPAADVRPVVLCRDCVNYKTKYCAIDIWHEDITIYKVKETDFCSYGERK